MEYEYVIDLEMISNIQNEYNNCCKKLDEICNKLANSALANSEGIISSLYASIIGKYNKLKSFSGKTNSVWGEYINGVLTLENSLASDDRLNSTISANPCVIVGDLVPRKLWNNTKGPTLWSNNSSLGIISTMEMKIQQILEEYNLTREQFYEICATVRGEAAPNSYEDAYAVINTMYNRLNDPGYSNSDNLYKIAIARGQFVAYGGYWYKSYLNKIKNVDNIDEFDDPILKAVTDFLTTKEKLHDYKQFRSWNSNYIGVRTYYKYGDGNMYF